MVAHASSVIFRSSLLLLLRSAWRHRLPNDFESLSDWDDVFLWRSHMFSAITSNFHWSEPGTLATLHDKPWTAIRMAKTARKQKMREVRGAAGMIPFSIMSAYSEPCDDVVRRSGGNVVSQYHY